MPGRRENLRERIWMPLVAGLACSGVSLVHRDNTVARHPMPTAAAPAANSATTKAQSGARQTDKESWLVYSGETHCKGITETVSFAVSTRSREVRDLTIEDTCQHPRSGTPGTVQWKLPRRFPTDSNGLFSLSALDWTLSAQSAVSIRGDLRAVGRIAGTDASGTFSDHIEIECDGGRMLRNCRKWTARAVTNRGARHESGTGTAAVLIR